VSEFKGAARQSDVNTTKASAHLPGLDIDIIYRRSPDGEAEQISINLQAVPSFEAFGRFLEAANPFAIWIEAARLAWSPWLVAARAAMLPLSLASPPKAVSDVPTGSVSERRQGGIAE
jgi:hypothetical protein